MIFRIIFISLFFAFPQWASTQVHYNSKEASFRITEKPGAYLVECTLNREVAGSRSLRRIQNRLRLRAVDLVGSYIIFNQLSISHPDRNQLFGAFVDYSNLSFDAVIEKFSVSQWDVCDGARCISFQCNKDDFVVGQSYLSEDFDLTEIMLMDFRNKKTMASACNIISADMPDIAQTLNIELLFLSGRASISSDIDRLLRLNPGSRLETTLFGTDSLMENLTAGIFQEPINQCHFGEMVKSKILFTSASVLLKNNIYQSYLDQLNHCENDWYQLQYFAAVNRDTSGFYGFEEATVFDVIGAYPLALNVFGLRTGYNTEYYNLALEAFSREEIAEALELLRNEINYSGISSGALNLTGACYRLMGNPQKALPYLLLAFYLDADTTYLAGNTCICLHAMNYSGVAKIAQYFLNTGKTDAWSESQIINILNP
jgi:tetratricopeptide (TPR) repeat protein